MPVKKKRKSAVGSKKTSTILTGKGNRTRASRSKTAREGIIYDRAGAKKAMREGASNSEVLKARAGNSATWTGVSKKNVDTIRKEVNKSLVSQRKKRAKKK